MGTHEVPAAEFKAKCLQLLSDVAATGEPLVITKRGKPIAQVLPMPATQSLFGAMKRSVLAQTDLVSPTGEAWEVDA